MSIDSAEQGGETAIREVRQALDADQAEFVGARLRISALEMSVEGSATVLESYRRQFEAGRKSWLDLLNAVRELAQNQYALVGALVAMNGAMHRLQIRMDLKPQ